MLFFVKGANDRKKNGELKVKNIFDKIDFLDVDIVTDLFGANKRKVYQYFKP